MTSGFAFAYKNLIKKMKENELKQDAIEKGIQVLLRDRLIQECSSSINKGSCSIETLDDIKALYEQYHILGGNGTVVDLLKKIRDLPIDQKEE